MDKVLTQRLQTLVEECHEEHCYDGTNKLFLCVCVQGGGGYSHVHVDGLASSELQYPPPSLVMCQESKRTYSWFPKWKVIFMDMGDICSAREQDQTYKCATSLALA